MHYSKDTLGPAAAPAQLCQGRKSLFNPRSLCSGTNPVNTWSCWLCQHCHGSAVQHSSVWKEKAWRQMEPGHMTKVHEQTSAPSRSSFLWFPESQPLSAPINSHPRLDGNTPRLGTCLKGELSIAKSNHIRKC